MRRTPAASMARKRPLPSTWGMAFAALLAVAGTAAAQAPSHRNDQPPSVIPTDLDPCRYFDAPGEPMVGFFIEMDEEGGLTPMRVPTRFFEDRSDHQEGATHGTQLFVVTVPEFEPIRRAEKGRRNAAGEPWDWMHFVIKDILPLEDTAGLQLLRRDLPFGDPRRMEQRENLPDPRDFPNVSAPHGLTQVMAADRLRFGHDLFVDYGDDGTLNAWILCSTPGVDGIRNGRCQHYFRAAGMDATASYRRSEVPNWARIQSNITRFLICATSDAL